MALLLTMNSFDRENYQKEVTLDIRTTTHFAWVVVPISDLLKVFWSQATFKNG